MNVTLKPLNNGLRVTLISDRSFVPGRQCICGTKVTSDFYDQHDLGSMGW